MNHYQSLGELRLRENSEYDKAEDFTVVNLKTNVRYEQKHFYYGLLLFDKITS